MSNLQVEIGICTWNRAAQLATTLARFAELRASWDALNHIDWRIIVVDNNSTDATTRVISGFRSQLEIVAAHEARPGHVYARNRVAEMACGDLLLWTDDDVTVDAAWLPVYAEAAIKQIDVSFWGSKIIPRFENCRTPPKWISDNWSKLSGCFAERDLGDYPHELASTGLPYGANFAIRTTCQKQFGFDRALGRAESEIIGEDELELFRQLLDAGHKGYWLPDAPIEHRIDRSRMTTRYVAKYFEGQGRVLVDKDQPWTRDVSALKKEATHELFWSRVKRCFSTSDVWVSHLIRGSLARGQWQAMEQSMEN